MASLRKRTAELLEVHRGAGGWGHVINTQHEELKHETCPHCGEGL